MVLSVPRRFFCFLCRQRAPTLIRIFLSVKPSDKCCSYLYYVELSPFWLKRKPVTKKLLKLSDLNKRILTYQAWLKCWIIEALSSLTWSRSSSLTWSSRRRWEQFCHLPGGLRGRVPPSSSGCGTHKTNTTHQESETKPHIGFKNNISESLRVKSNEEEQAQVSATKWINYVVSLVQFLLRTLELSAGAIPVTRLMCYSASLLKG